MSAKKIYNLSELPILFCKLGPFLGSLKDHYDQFADCSDLFFVYLLILVLFNLQLYISFADDNCEEGFEHFIEILFHCI